ncbi:MAG: hypothetical protein QM533_06875 [Cytophagales bacterium]|nr:hypothetical protein [Cytophagales bacterium]
MNPVSQLRFSVNDNINGKDVGPSHVPIKLLDQFTSEVRAFIKGDGNEIDLDDLIISIEKGSLRYDIMGTALLAATTLWADIGQLSASNSLANIQPKRADIMAKWQARALISSHRKYAIFDQDNNYFVRVSSDSHYVNDDAKQWFEVEKYLIGDVIEAGGKSNVNIHLITPQSKNPLTIQIDKALLSKREDNFLFKRSKVRVVGEENLYTGALRNLRLIDFKPYAPKFSPDKFAEMVKRGTKAWADVTNPSQWLEEQRGYAA